MGKALSFLCSQDSILSTAVNLRSCQELGPGSSQSPGGAWRTEEFWLMIGKPLEEVVVVGIRVMA